MLRFFLLTCLAFVFAHVFLFSWHTDPIQRPPFEKICDRLRLIQSAIKPDDNTPYGLGANLSKAAQLSAHGANIAGDSSSPPNM